LGPEGAEVEPDGGRSGPAVVRVGDRPLRLVGDAVPRVVGEVDGGPGLAVLVAQDQRAGGGRVVDLLAADHRLVLGGDQFVFDLWRGGGRFMLGARHLRVWSVAGFLGILGGERSEGKREGKDEGNPGGLLAHAGDYPRYPRKSQKVAPSLF